MQYVAFLRGINVGGNALIKMAELKRVLEKAGLKNVKTVLASGNAVFESSSSDTHKLAEKIETALEKKYRKRIKTFVRHINDLKMLDKAQPFKGIIITKDTRLYVTFLDKVPKTHLKAGNDFFRVVKTCPFAICTVIMLTPGHATLGLMGYLEKHYGKNITTRNWNTIQRILIAAA